MCPCCKLLTMTMDDLRVEGHAGRLGSQLTAVVIEGADWREYRLPTTHEADVAKPTEAQLDLAYANLPHGRIREPLSPESTRSISCDLYGVNRYSEVFTARQQLALGALVYHSRCVRGQQSSDDRLWADAVYRFLALNIDRVADRSSTFGTPDPTPTQSGVMHTFARFALAMTWDFAEAIPIAHSSGGYLHSLEWIARVVEHISASVPRGEPARRGQRRRDRTTSERTLRRRAD